MDSTTNKTNLRLTAISTARLGDGRRIVIRARKDRKASKQIFVLCGNCEYVLSFDETTQLVNNLTDLVERLDRGPADTAEAVE